MLKPSLPNHSIAKHTEEYWQFMRDFNKKHFSYHREMLTVATNAQSNQYRTVKIALIDTGVDTSDPFILPEVERGRITGRSWVGTDPNDFGDTCGHGTHLIRLI